MRKWLLLVVLMVLVWPIQAQDETQDTLIFGMVLVGSQDDGGWSQAHYEGGQYAADFLDAEMLVYDDYNEVSAAETGDTLESIVADFIEQGATFIILTSDDFEEEGTAVARLYPDIPFVHIAGDSVLLGEAPSNMSNLMGQMEFGKIMGGCAAALTTETGKIGYVGSLINSETRRLAASAYLGAQYCWTTYRQRPADELVFAVDWVGFWFYIPSVTANPTQLTYSLFINDFDVVIAGIDTPEPINVANEFYEAGQEVHAVSYNSDVVCSANPEVCIGNMFFNWGPAYVRLLRSYQEGDWQPMWDWSRPESLYSTTSIVGFTRYEAFPRQWRNEFGTFISQLDQYNRNDLSPNSIPLWQGPLLYQDGTLLAEDGEVVNMLDIWYLPQLLQGMDGDSNP